MRSHLERVEPAPGDPEHPDRPGAPGLGGEPGDHLDGVGLLEGRVLVEQHAVRLAAPSHVDAHAPVAVAGEVGVPRRIRAGRSVALAVGDVLEQRRNRLGLGVLGKPDPRRQAASVRERDPLVLDHADRAGKARPDSLGHRRIALLWRLRDRV